MWPEALKKEKEIGFTCFGETCVNMILHLLQKEKVAQRESLDFTAKLNGYTRTTGQQLVSVLPVLVRLKGLVNCSDKEIALLQNTHIKVGGAYLGCISMLYILHRAVVLVFSTKGENIYVIQSTQSRYCHPDHGDKVFLLASLDDKGANLEHCPLFGGAENVFQPMEGLKKWKPTKRECPLLCRS